MLECPQNNFDSPTKLFSDLYLAKFLDFNKIVLSIYNLKCERWSNK